MPIACSLEKKDILAVVWIEGVGDYPRKEWWDVVLSRINELWSSLVLVESVDPNLLGIFALMA